MVTLSFTIFSGQKNYNRAHMLFQVLCGLEPIFYTTHPNEEPFLFSSSESVRELQFAQFLPDWKNYTALFVASDYYALEVSSFLQSRGIRVPEDISITGFDDLIYASLARPKLTTMSQNIGKKAKMAVEALLSLCEKKGEQKDTENLWEEKWQLPVKLVERESVSDRMYKNK